MKRILFAIAALAVAALCACDDSDDTISDVTAQEIEYGYSIDDQQVTAAGFCVPAVSVEQLLEDNDVWEEYGDRIDSVEIAKIEYRVPANNTEEAGVIELYVGEAAAFDPDEVVLVAQTQEILAQTPVTEYERVNWIGDGRATMNGYVADYRDENGIPYFLCGLFAQGDTDTEPVAVDMTMDLIVTIKITVLPIG